MRLRRKLHGVSQIDFVVEPASEEDQTDWLEMRLRLWPDEDRQELAADLADMLDETNAKQCWIARQVDGLPIGFAEADIRQDYVEDCDSPVPYLEGIWVAPNFRRAGVADTLLATVEEWAREAGFAEIASDALLDNRASHGWHEAVGFDEVERVITYRKEI